MVFVFLRVWWLMFSQISMLFETLQLGGFIKAVDETPVQCHAIMIYVTIKYVHIT